MPRAGFSFMEVVMPPKKKSKHREPPITLRPMNFDQAVDALLLAKPRRKKATGKKKG
jgi:hypothetical protein